MACFIGRKKRCVGGKREMDTGEAVNSCHGWLTFNEKKKLTEPNWFEIHSDRH